MSKSMRFGRGLLLVVCLLAVVYTLFVIFQPEIFIKRSFPGYTGQDWAAVAAVSPGVAVYIKAVESQVGAFALCVIIASLFVLFTAFRKGEPWAWYFFLIASGGGWLINIIFHIFSKSPLGLAINIAGIAAELLALIVTAKDFFGKKPV